MILVLYMWFTNHILWNVLEDFQPTKVNIVGHSVSVLRGIQKNSTITLMFYLSLEKSSFSTT